MNKPAVIRRRRSLFACRRASFLALAVALVAWVASCKVPSTSTDVTLPRTTSTTDPASAVSTRHTELAFDALPLPNATGDSENGSHYVPRPAGASLNLPSGFSIRPFAEGGFDAPRWLARAPSGDIFLADSEAGTVWVLRDTHGTGVADSRFPFAEGLNQPFGIAFHQSWVYIANTDAIIRFRYTSGQTEAAGHPERVAVLPGHGYNQHWTRNIVISADGTSLFVSIGSETNDDDDPSPRASILVMKPDGSGQRPYARGLRNPVGMAFNPTTQRLWAAVEERDRLGDDLVPDYVTEIKEGAFYGWPFAYLGPHEDPRHRGERPDLVARTIAPDVLIQAHSAVLGLAFYDGTMFPAEYKGDAFVALHGSWNRSRRTGYKVVRIRFNQGRPVGGYDDFVTGWMVDEHSPDVWGRPVGIVVARDGALLVADDAAKMIWRVSYDKPAGR